MIRLSKFCRSVGFEIRPAAFVFELPVRSFPTFGFFFGIQQRVYGALIHGDAGVIGNLKQSEHMLRFFLHPLIAADRSDAEDVEFLGLKKDKDGLLVAGSRAAGVLIDDDFDFLGGRRSVQKHCQQENARKIPRTPIHEAPSIMTAKNLGQTERAQPAPELRTIALEY